MTAMIAVNRASQATSNNNNNGSGNSNSSAKKNATPRSTPTTSIRKLPPSKNNVGHSVRPSATSGDNKQASETATSPTTPAPNVTLPAGSGSGAPNGDDVMPRSSDVNATATTTGVGSTILFSGNLKFASAIEGSSHAMSVRFSDDGNFIAAGFAEGTVKLYDVQTCKCVSTLADSQTVVTTGGQSQPVTCLRFGNNGKLLLATYASGIVKFWVPDSTSSSTWSVDESRHTLAAAFNPSGNKFVTTGSTPQIHQYDTETGKRFMTLEAREHRAIMDGHRDRVFAVQYHANQPNIFLTGGWDNTVQYWDDRQQHAVRKFYGPHICGDALDIDAERGQILTGSWTLDSPNLQIWDFASASKIRDVPNDRLLGHSSLYCAQWLGHDQMICGGSERHVARSISRQTHLTCGHVTSLTNGVYSVDSSSRAEDNNNNNNNSYSGRQARLALASGSVVYVIKYSTLVTSSASTSAALGLAIAAAGNSGGGIK